MEYLFGIVWLVWTISLIILYHRIFNVYYFKLGNGLLKEFITAAIIGCIMAAITFYLWWLTAIIIIIIGFINARKTNKKIHIIIAIILSITVSIIGMGIKENSSSIENESVMITQIT